MKRTEALRRVLHAGRPNPWQGNAGVTPGLMMP